MFFCLFVCFYLCLENFIFQKQVLRIAICCCIGSLSIYCTVTEIIALYVEISKITQMRTNQRYLLELLWQRIQLPLIISAKDSKSGRVEKFYSKKSDFRWVLIRGCWHGKGEVS